MEPLDIEPLAAGLSDMAPLDMEPPDCACASAEPAIPKLITRAKAARFPKIVIVFSSYGPFTAGRSNVLEQVWRKNSASFIIAPPPQWRHPPRLAPVPPL